MATLLGGGEGRGTAAPQAFATNLQTAGERALGGGPAVLERPAADTGDELALEGAGRWTLPACVSGGAAPRGLTRRPHGGSGSGKPEPADSGAVAHGGRARTVPPGGRRNNGLPVGNQPLALKRPSLRPPGTHGSLPQAEPQNQLPGALSGCGSQPGASATPVPGNDSLAGGRRSWQGLGQTHPSIQAQPQQGCSLAPSSGTT